MEGPYGDTTIDLAFMFIFIGLYWVLGTIIKSITRKEIRTRTGTGAAAITGYFFRHIVFPH
jgi:hypothetical protein